MKREKFPTRTITLVGAQQVATLLSLVPHLPLDSAKPLEVVIREKQPVRKLDANAAYWAGTLRDMEEQAYVGGRTYSAEVWHYKFKVDNLPEEYDEELTKEGYRKWDYTPDGERVLVGSTTQLTGKGFSIYTEKCCADGANLGVQFSAAPGQSRRAA
jgi:hypothetical protein